MTKYTVNWTELISCEADVEADTKEEAVGKALQLSYNDLYIENLEINHSSVEVEE